jgi:type II pantothenate kinase
LIPIADPSERAAGVDVGTTLTKLALRDAEGLQLRILPSQAIERAAREIEAFGPAALGITGTGATGLARLLGLDTTPRVEFECWRAGVAALLGRQGAGAGERDLLVSIGTGTTLLLAEPASVSRVAGSALGGGTLLGLGAALAGSSDHDELVALAARGDRGKVDLRVADVDPEGALPLSAEFTASFCARLAQGPAAPADAAHSLMGLLGETLGTLASAVAAAVQAKRVVYGGGTLRNNPPLRKVLGAYTFTGETIFLQNGEFTGAVGALELASQPV